MFEPRSAFGEEARFATGGLLAPAGLAPWATAGAAPVSLVWGRTPTLRNGSALTSADLAWLRHWRRAARAREPTPQPPLLALERLARYSHERLKALAAGLKLDFERSAGAPLLLRSAAGATALKPVAEALRQAGTEACEVDAATAGTLEPGGRAHAAGQRAAHARR